ncbi:MAG: hypothetical protein EXR83_14425 [Gammaproteobacteria bacterium]|nr:hypothetical protein [Gammaproteobacteria bacterium]
MSHFPADDTAPVAATLAQNPGPDGSTSTPIPARFDAAEPLPVAAFSWHCLRRDVSNFALLKHRHFDGFLITMQNSGTHWLKHMMSTALALEFNLPPPAFLENNLSNDFIGHPRHPRRYPQVPRLASTHSIPHVWFDSRLLRSCVAIPRYTVLVRDLRAALVSNYEKHKVHYGVTFKEYLRGDPRGRRYVFDLWGGIHFLNRWGRVRRRFPADTLQVRYEDLQTTPETVLTAIFAHFGIALAPRHLAPAIASGSKQRMTQLKSPNNPAQRIVRDDARPAVAWFDAEDRQYFDRVVARCLHYREDYDWRWPVL